MKGRSKTVGILWIVRVLAQIATGYKASLQEQFLTISPFISPPPPPHNHTQTWFILPLAGPLQ